MSIEHPGGPPGLAERLDDLLLRLDDWRARPVVVWGIGLLLTAVVVGGWWIGRTTDAVPLGDQIPMASSDQTGSTQASSEAAGSGEAASISADVSSPGETVPSGAAAGPDELGVAEPNPAEPDLVVHVVGAVRSPGLVEVAPGSRLSDVVIAAGGPLPDADTQRLNLAAPAVDGMQVRIPLVEDIDQDQDSTQSDGQGQGGIGTDDEVLVILPDTASSTVPGAPSGPVNLNTATGEQLETLPGIGPAIAAAIIGWREEHGRFAVPEDLMEVPGIGPVKMGALRDRVTT